MYNRGNLPEICRSCKNEVPPGAPQCLHCGRIFERNNPHIQQRIPSQPYPVGMPPRQHQYAQPRFQGRGFPTNMPPGYEMPMQRQGMLPPHDAVDTKKKKKKSKKKLSDKLVESSSDEEEEMLTIRTKVKRKRNQLWNNHHLPQLRHLHL
ncbi:hypothetical protein EhV145_00141 [Emiliania huxleyi virus 145]|nr:hypothetical protein EhV145_00141 [Emiliania huxleyi virus 145]